MSNSHFPHITCPHCKSTIYISEEVLFNGGTSVCSGCGSELKAIQNQSTDESLSLLKTFVDKINQIKGI